MLTNTLFSPRKTRNFLQASSPTGEGETPSRTLPAYPSAPTVHRFCDFGAASTPSASQPHSALVPMCQSGHQYTQGPYALNEHFSAVYRPIGHCISSNAKKQTTVTIGVVCCFSLLRTCKMQRRRQSCYCIMTLLNAKIAFSFRGFVPLTPHQGTCP